MPTPRTHIWNLGMLQIAHTYLSVLFLNGSVNASAESGTVHIVSAKSEGSVSKF